MGFGMVATRSGFDSDHLGNHQRSLCKKWMKDIAEFIRDLTVLFWWVLPVNAVNMRLYCLIFARIVIYIVEATAFYSLTVTILAGTEDEVGFLVELTRLVLCTAAEQMGTRVKREAEDWEGLVQRVNNTNSKLAGLLQDLFQTTTRPSLTYLTNVCDPGAGRRQRQPNAGQRHRLSGLWTLQPIRLLWIRQHQHLSHGIRQ